MDFSEEGRFILLKTVSSMHVNVVLIVYTHEKKRSYLHLNQNTRKYSHSKERDVKKNIHFFILTSNIATV